MECLCEVFAFLTEEASHVSLNGNTFEVSAIKLLKAQTKEDYRIRSIWKMRVCKSFTFVDQSIVDVYSGYDLSWSNISYIDSFFL